MSDTVIARCGTSLADTVTDVWNYSVCDSEVWH